MIECAREFTESLPLKCSLLQLAWPKACWLEWVLEPVFQSVYESVHESVFQAMFQSMFQQPVVQ